MDHYDLIIVGSGAGLVILEEALQAGRRCALIEKGKFGGTCLTRGCIPSKILVYPADLICEAAHARKIGVDLRLDGLDWPTISQRMWHFIDKSRQIEASLLRLRDKLTVYRGTGAFVGPYTLQVHDERDGRTGPLRADQIVLAPGGRTAVPPIDGLAETGFVTSETFFGEHFPDRPWSSLTIIGGGAIGVEFAHIFAAFGTQVTIVERSDRLVSIEEAAISQMLATAFSARGISVLASQDVIAVAAVAQGKQVTLRDQANGAISHIVSDEILLASGIRSNADLLHIERSGIATDSRGYIITDDALETNQKNIWALGDINGKFQFRHKANYEAEICLHNVLRPDLSRHTAQYTTVPWAIFTHPQIAHVGLTEAQVRARGSKYRVGINACSAVAKGYAMGYEEQDPDNGFVKLLVDENMKIIGVHIIGPQASLLIQPFVYLMNAGFRCHAAASIGRAKLKSRSRQIPGPFPPCPEAGTYDPIARSMVIHPALSEQAAWVIDNLTWSDPGVIE